MLMCINDQEIGLLGLCVVGQCMYDIFFMSSQVEGFCVDGEVVVFYDGLGV